MATGAEVLTMLIPSGGWIIAGDDYKDIQFIEADSITEAEFKAGFSKVDAYKEKQATDRATAKAALLERLGITADEAALLLG
jgi:hypothetical protein